MTRHILKIFLLVSIVLLCFLGIKYRGLKRDKTSLEQEITAFEKKLNIVKRQYEEAKNKESALIRTKLALEAQNLSMDDEYERLKQEEQQVNREIDALKQKLADAAQKCDERIDELLADQKRLQSISEGFEEKYKEMLKIAEKRQEEITRIGSVNDYLSSEIERINEEREQCMLNNKKLCEIAEHVLKEYQNKGVLDSILQKEPLTNMKTREIEKMVQEYRDMIDKQRIE